MRLIPLLVLLASPAFAQSTTPSPSPDQSFALKDGDTPLTDSALQERLVGQIVTFFDDGQSEYYNDGRYTYTYADQGGTAYGYWSVSEGGAVCIEFVNGFSRCDMYVQNAGRLLLIDEDGNRYPVRP